MLGLLYFVFAIVSGFVGLGYSFVMRLELSCVGCNVLFGDYQFYNCLITAHGLIMIFGFVMPVMLGGITNYWLPILNGFPDMLFPRLNNMSFLLYLNGCLLLLLGLLHEEGIGCG
jgi:heme/copper-type cytochrome/quinol oxidase subunit 1